MSTRYLPLLCALIAGPASAVPPAPPSTDLLDGVQTFIRSLTAKDFGAYSSVLADDFVGNASDQAAPQSRTVWLDRMRTAFSNPGFHVTILQVFYGPTLEDGVLKQQVMLVEKASETGLPIRTAGGALSYLVETNTIYSTETLTLERGKVTKISSSPLFGTELSTSGQRTDIK